LSLRHIATRPLLLAAAVAAGAASTGCADALHAFGPTDAEARVNAEQFFGGIAVRFDSITRDARYQRARTRFSGNFLAPSALYADTSLWSSRTATDRTLLSQGRFSGTSYDFSARPTVPMPTALGESRHRMTLINRDKGMYGWETQVDMALGPMRASMIEDVMTALVGSVGTRTEAQIRSDYTIAAAKSTNALGRAFSIEHLRVTPGADGARLVDLAIRVRPDLARPRFPRFAQFLEKYIATSAYDLALTDKRGAQWVLATAKENRLTVMLREIDGRFVPLQGPIRAIPDTLRLTGKASAHGAFATVHINAIDAEFVIVRSPTERAWRIRWNHEPQWDFPLSVNRFVSGPLRTPFQGDGVLFSLGFRDGPTGQLTLHREINGTFQETRLIRWMGSLAGSVFGDWEGPVEPEASRFIADAFFGLRDDATNLPMHKPPRP
jgi:hypothetical protein